MRLWIKRMFLNHWQRKTTSLGLAVLVWVVVDQSQTSTRTIASVPVRFINIPPGKAVEGLEEGGILSRRISLTLVGKSRVLDEISSSDLEVVIDAADKPDIWTASISKQNLVSLHPEVDIRSGIQKIYYPSLEIQMTRMITEQIPVAVAAPVGESPPGYELVEVWPGQLEQTISGPEEVVSRLRSRGLQLMVDLDRISVEELEREPSQSEHEVVFPLPRDWKQLKVPSLSSEPLSLNDPAAEGLSLIFTKSAHLLLDAEIPALLYFPLENARRYNPRTVRIASQGALSTKDGVALVKGPFLIFGVSRAFLEVVSERLQLEVVVDPAPSGRLPLQLSLADPKALEEKYVTLLSNQESSREEEEALRSRFRSYARRMKLFRVGSPIPLSLLAKLEEGEVRIEEALPE